MCDRAGQQGSSLWSLLLGMVLSLALLFLWQRLLGQAHRAAGVQQARTEAMAQLQWVQAQLHQDVQATDSGPCVQPRGHGIRAGSPQSLTLTPRLWSQPLLASQGLGSEQQYTVTRVVVPSSPALLDYLAAAWAYEWTLSRCDVAWPFRPRGGTPLPGQRLAIDIPGGWPIGPHPQNQPALVSLQVSETIRYWLDDQGVARHRVGQPDVLPTRAPLLTQMTIRPWWRTGCGAESGFQTTPSDRADGVFYEVVLGWAGFDQAMTLVPSARQGC